jgi:hypothetical protein
VNFVKIGAWVLRAVNDCCPHFLHYVHIWVKRALRHLHEKLPRLRDFREIAAGKAVLFFLMGVRDITLALVP